MSVTAASIGPYVPLSIPFTSSTALGNALDAVSREQLETLASPNSADAYTRRVLVDTPELLVIAARWRSGARCDLHGHSESAGRYRVVSGVLEEERYVPQGGGLQYEVERLEAGDESFLPAGSIHQLRAASDAISIHAYSPRPDDAVSDLSPTELSQIDAARRAAAEKLLPRSAAGRHNVESVAEFETVEQLAANLADGWQAYEQTAYGDGSYRVPHRVLEELRSSGLLAAPLPRQAGGLASSLLETARAITSLAERAPAAALASVMPLGNAATCRIPLSAVPREQVGALRRSQRWIADRVVRGRIIAVANSEPGAGGSLSHTKTTATVGADGIMRLTGRKTFATLGPDADYFLCAARTEADANGPARIDGYFVHRNAPGLTLDDRWDPLGMRPTASVGLQLIDAPVEGVLGYPGCLEGVNARHWSTLLFSAVFLGIGHAALREGAVHAGGSAWGRAKLAEHALALDAARGYLESTCQAEVWPMPAELLGRVQQVKTFVTQTVVQAATQVAMLSGGRCYSAQHRVYRLLADALAGPLLRPPLGNAMDSMMERYS